MPTTSNFGWTTPADTDLVKDGAAAIRTLGNGIDTSFLDLKGGTTGQNLRKASNTDLDFTFAGDATNTVVDAAGDLLYGTASDTLGRLAIGTAGQVLKVNSGATAPEWGSATSNFVGCLLTNAGSQTISYNSATELTFDTERIDTDAFHSTVSNTGRITIPSGKGGKYLVHWRAAFAANTTGDRGYYLYKNGAIADAGYTGGMASGVTDNHYSTILDLAAADYLQFYVLQTISSTGTLVVYGNTTLLQGVTQFGVQFLGA